MKKKLLMLVLLFVAFTAFTASPLFGGESFAITANAADEGIITSIEISEDVKALLPTSTGERLKVTITPSDADNQVINWTSSNENVCKIDTNGYLLPQGKGKCVITATTTDGSNLSVSCKVIVANKAETIIVSGGSDTLTVGSETTFKATVTTESGETYDGYVKWTSSNEEVAKVDSDGKVTARYPGNARITAMALDGTKVDGSCLVTVTQPVEGVSLPESKVCNVGGTVTLTPTFMPEYASNKNVTWSSDDETVATVSPSGVVTGESEGIAVITAETEDGSFTAQCIVTVEIFPTSVSLDYAAIKLKAGGRKTLTETVLPSDASNKDVVWSSSDTSVAKVSQNGVVTGVAGGTATITVKTKRGGIKTSCKVTVVEAVTGVSIKNNPETMYKGQVYTIKADIKPSTANNKNVTWTSSHPNIIKADSKTGKLTALKTGRAKITVKTEDGSFVASCKITVTKKISVLGVKLNVTSKTVAKGKTYTLVPSFTPSNASDKTVKWTSSDPSVAKVSSKGVVTALKSGKAVITCTTVDGKYTATCNIKVTVPVTGVSLNKASLNLGTGRKYTLKATITPAKATNQKLTWKSSDSSVATVDEKGVVRGIKKGTAVITVKTNNGGYVAKCKVKVYKAVTSVKLDRTEATVPKGERIALVATVSPSDAKNKGVTWSSSNPSVATVSETGIIQGKRLGTTVITVKTDDGSYTAECKVKVVLLAESITLDYSSITLDVGKRKALSYKILPNLTTDKSATWKSSNKNIVRVSKAGIIRAVSAGTATITVTSGDGNAMAMCKVTVTQPPTGISIVADKTSVKIGAKITLKASVKPSNVTDKGVIWTSSDTSVATVSQKGVVTGIKKGTVEITATTANGLYKDTIKITVKKPVAGVSLNKTIVTLTSGKKTALTANVLPSDASNKAVTWKSSNNDVATVSSDGIITAVSSGYAVITVVTKDGKKTATCQVQVISNVTGIKLNKTKLTLDLGKTATLKATVLPGDATNRKVSWSSSDKSVLKVSSKGVLTPVSEGTAKITVKTLDGGYKATCTVTVRRELKLMVNSIKNSAKRIKIEVDTLSYNSNPVFNIATKTVKLNGKAVKCTVSKEPNEFGNYYIFIDISALKLREGTKVKIKIPAGFIKNQAGTQYSSAETFNYTIS